MLIEIGIVIATYYGTKFFGNRQKMMRAEKEAAEAKPVRPLGGEPDKPVEDEAGLRRAELQHYTNAGLASIGFSAVRQFLNPAVWPFSLALYIYAVIPYMREVEKALFKDRKVDANVLFFSADMLALSINQYLPASVGVWLMHYGKMSVEKAKGVAEKLIVNVFDQLPQDAWLVVENVESKIPLRQVKANDILVVNTGEVIPADGIITEGMATIDQHVLTGEFQPAEKGVGDPVFASTIIITGRIYLRVENSGEDTAISKISQILRNSTNFKSKVQLKGEQWADKATLPMLAMSGVVLPTLGPVSTSVFLNSHIGNRIKVFAPLITLNHISRAAQKGILIKDGRAIEALSAIDTVLFDKTGTLTGEVPEIGKITACDSWDEKEVLTYAAAAERKLTHPIARAIIEKAAALNLILPDIQNSQYRIGYGITVHLDHKVIRVGSSRFITSEGIGIPSAIAGAQDDMHERGDTQILVAVNDRVCGAVEIRPRLRPEVKNIVKELEKLGIKYTAIVSGDHRRPTEELAAQLGVQNYFYDTLPEDKALIVERLQKEGRSVCYIGDGVNDAIAMKKADVSISIRGASTLATDMAEIILLDGGMVHLRHLFEIGKRLDDKLKTTLHYTIAPGVLNLGGAFLIGYGITTSLIVNATCGFLAMKDALIPLDENPEERMER